MKRVLRFIWALIKYVMFGGTVNSDVYHNRTSTCYSCEYLDNAQCSLCGCYIKRKAKWTTESCPKNKW
jgi:hypothetical protein